MLRSRHLLRSLVVVAALALAPTMAYECMQKSSEWFLSEHVSRRGFWRLSARAEEETRWRSRTGYVVVDHALHEWAETRRFYLLAKRRLDSPYY